MEPLLKVTSLPLHTVQFSQPARLVPTNDLELERRKAMARYFAFQARSGIGSSLDFKYINQVNKAFSVPHHPAPMPSHDGAAAMKKSPPAAVSAPVKPAVLTPSVSGKNHAPKTEARTFSSAGIPEPQAAYTLQRGSFEMRVAKGELTYIPPLVMTIITQYPEIHYEYTGDDAPQSEDDFPEENVD